MRQRFELLALATLALASCRPAGEGASGNASDPVAPDHPTPGAPPAGQGEGPEQAAPNEVSDVLVGVWVLVTYQAESGFEEAARANEHYTIEFTADGRVAGQADCNRYTGAYSEPVPGRLVMGNNMAVTMAACPPASRSGDFLRAVSSATRYELVGGELKLFGGGDALTFAREASLSPD